MIVIVMVDKNGGMLFNNRRQSRDENLIQWITDNFADKVLWMNSYTSKLFVETAAKIIIDEDFLNTSSEDAVCINETCNLTNVKNKIDQLIVCCWNRDYPSDFALDIELNKCELLGTETIVGSSHEEITIEKYQMRGDY